jgi:hypothetical protein
MVVEVSRRVLKRTFKRCLDCHQNRDSLGFSLGVFRRFIGNEMKHLYRLFSKYDHLVFKLRWLSNPICHEAIPLGHLTSAQIWLGPRGCSIEA